MNPEGKTIIQQITQGNMENKKRKKLTQEQEEDIKQKIIKDFQTETPEIKTQLNITPTYHREYADDTIRYLDLQQPGHALTHIKNYDIVSKGRKIPIQWKKVETLTKQNKIKKYKRYPAHMVKYNLKIQENTRKNSKHEQHHQASNTTKTESSKTKLVRIKTKHISKSDSI